MDAKKVTDATATVIIGQRVRPGCEQAFEAWQQETNRTASEYPGFIGAEINRPTAIQPDWVVVYRFDSIAHVQTWINSAARRERLAAGEQYFDGPSTQQVVRGGARQSAPVTMVVTHRVDSGHTDEFLSWQDRLHLAESKFRGFRGAELFPPIAGVQDEWTALYRFETADDLERWLISPERKALLAEGGRFSDFHARTVDSSFGSWFAFDDHGTQAPPPSDAKTSIAVWVGLYPTVVLLGLALSPLKMPMWLDLLFGTLLSSFLMTFVTMPLYVNPLLKRWLYPRPNFSESQANWRGVGVVAAALAVWAVIFYLVTDLFWQLP